MTESTPRRGTFLKVIGILMIVAGSAALIAALTAVFGIALIASAAKRSEMTVEELGINAVLLYTGGACLLLNAAAELTAGIVGCANCAKPEKAKVCLFWGILTAALCVVGQAAVVLGGGHLHIPALALGLILPVLFIIGAAKNRS